MVHPEVAVEDKGTVFGGGGRVAATPSEGRGRAAAAAIEGEGRAGGAMSCDARQRAGRWWWLGQGRKLPHVHEERGV